jgi:hypothetical protein
LKTDIDQPIWREILFRSSHYRPTPLGKIFIKKFQRTKLCDFKRLSLNYSEDLNLFSPKNYRLQGRCNHATMRLNNGLSEGLERIGGKGGKVTQVVTINVSFRGSCGDREVQATVYLSLTFSTHLIRFQHGQNRTHRSSGLPTSCHSAWQPRTFFCDDNSLA